MLKTMVESAVVTLSEKLVPDVMTLNFATPGSVSMPSYRRTEISKGSEFKRWVEASKVCSWPYKSWLGASVEMQVLSNVFQNVHATASMVWGYGLWLGETTHTVIVRFTRRPARLF